MIWLKRILTWTARLLGGLVAAGLALIILIVLVGGFSRSGSQFVADRIAALVSADNRLIAIIDPAPLLSSPFSVGQITVSDAGGIYATIDGLTLDWSPQDLLLRRFSAETIRADKITVTRPPTVSAEPKPASDEPFSLPVEIAVRNLDLPTIHLGQALVQRELQLSAQGSLDIAGDTIASRLTATRLDDVGNNAIADILYAPNENRLRIRLDYQEPGDGIVGTLLQVPGRPPLSLRVDGEGPLDNWAGSITAALASRETIAVETTHQLDAAGTRQITAKGGGQFADLMPPELRDVFAGETAIDLKAALSPDGALTIDEGRLASAAITLAAKGRYDPQGDNDLTVAASANGDPVSLATNAGDLTAKLQLRKLDLTLKGNAAAADIKAGLDLAELTLPQGRFSDIIVNAESSRFDLLNRQGPVNAKLSVAGAQISDPEIAASVKAPLTASLEAEIAETIEIANLTITSDGIDAALSGTFDPTAQTFAGRVGVTVDSDVLPADLLQSIPAPISGPISATARVDFAAPAAVSLRELNLETSVGTAQGSLALDQEGGISTNLTGRLSDVGLFIDQTQGAAEFDISAGGPLDAIDADIKVVIPEGIAAGYRIDDLGLSINGMLNPQSPSGRLSLTGQLDGKPVNASAQLVSTGGVTKVEDLSLDIGPNRLTGALSLDPTFKPEGKLDFDFSDLSLLAALAGQDLGGDLRGTVTLSNSGGIISGKVNATGETLTREDVRVEKPVVDLTIDNLQTFSINGSVTAKSASQGANRVENARLQLERAGARTVFSLEALYDGAPAELRGSLQQGAAGLGISIESLTATPRGLPLTLSSPATINLADGGVAIEQTVIAIGSGRVTLNGRVGTTLDLKVDITNVPASVAAPFAPSVAPEGTINGRIDVRGQASAPVADYRLDMQGASIAQTRSAGLAAFGITANGRFENNRLTLESRISGGGIGLGVTGAVNLANNTALDLRVQGAVPLSALNTQLAAQGLVADGNANVNLTIGGNAAQPSITGTITTSGTRIVDVRRNLAIEDISTTINLTGNRAEIGNLTGNFATGGRVSASGYVDIRGAGLPAELSINLDKAVYVDGDTVTSTADARLILSGPLLAGPTLGGTVNLARTSVTLSESRPASLRELDIVHRHAPPQILRQQRDDRPAEGRTASAPIRLDLTISSPSQTFVRGRGIDAELGGTIALTGTASAPNVSGAFELRRGRMQILTRRLEITRATITFGGDLVPILDLEAQTLSGSTTLTIKLTGLASNPQVSFSSSPALPQDEVLAQLLFGQSMSRLSALQIAQLADAAAQLAGGRGTSLFQALRSTLGIDDLDISTDETGQTTISAGKYLNDRTYLELEQTGSGDAKAVINLDIGRGVKLKGEAGGTGAGGGIFYEKEY
ncbi:translocation/assembly module TamB domain-containing protein [Rhizobium sp. AAP43]|uniref:translocation/assembly module TamB domain-containing protein n=1 Tax=Rhizobium sp. AAP43 TaxID=1523420 RepID=UPI0006B9DD9F|nr:translocation/assembly module TamB domain-containing protein [Rhizobium sp. AAP43]KPF44964.1 hypothetical protein IP76_08900 [Rhizobium sp. AAP43]